MDGKQIVKLAVDLAAGGITADANKDRYGEGVLSAVLAISGGAIAGIAVNTALDVLDDHTGIVGDIGSVVDDVIGTFKLW